MSAPHITICICTFKRPELLRRLLQALRNLQTGDQFSYSIVVVDNHHEQSASPTVRAFRENSAIQTLYCVEPIQNIALARNRAIANAKSDFIAFIDDDEVPVAEWLLLLFETCVRFDTHGVLGPVLPDYTED